MGAGVFPAFKSQLCNLTNRFIFICQVNGRGAQDNDLILKKLGEPQRDSPNQGA